LKTAAGGSPLKTLKFFGTDILTICLRIISKRKH
jgi:hypothetical protein